MELYRFRISATLMPQVTLDAIPAYTGEEIEKMQGWKTFSYSALSY
jgi:hypothetical protein